MSKCISSAGDASVLVLSRVGGGRIEIMLEGV